MFELFSMHNPVAVALQDDLQTIRYGDLMREIAVRENALHGVRALAIMLDNSVEWVLWDLAALKAGIPCIPLPPFFTRAQTDHALQSAGVSHMITPSGLSETGIASKPLHEGTVKITFTSGTTGTPKGVCLPEKAMENVARGIVQVLGRDYAGKHASVLPLGILLENVAGVYSTLMAGGSVLLTGLARFDANYAQLHERLQETQASSVILVPEILRLLMAQIVAKGPLPSLKFIAVGGAKMDPRLIAQARSLGLPVYEGYGLSECASVVALNTPSLDRAGSVGTLLPHVKARISADGEVQIKSPGFSGYIGEPAPDVFSTGDLGSFDGEFLSITGRRKNVLITSYGRNVSPEWVEASLTAQPQIAQALVYGNSQPHLGALIVPTHPAADIAKAVSQANESLPDYAQVKSFQIVAPFTEQEGLLTGNGRMRREAIHTRYQALTEKENDHDILQYSG